MEPKDKKEKKEKKEKKGFGWFGTIVIVGVLIAAMTGFFDDAASDITKGAYGKGSDADKITATNTETGETVTLKDVEEVEVRELSEYANYSEEELIEVLGVEKNEMGFYPNENNINFICLDGKVYSIMIRKEHEGDANCRIFGVAIGDRYDEPSDEVEEKFTLLDSYEVEGGNRSAYINNETGNVLGIDYNEEGIVIQVSYSLENVEVPVEEDAYMEDNMENGDFSQQFQIYPGSTFESGSCEGMTLYANLTENYVDDSITISGFAVDYNGNEVEGLRVNVDVYPDADNPNWYSDMDGMYDLVLEDGYITIMEDWIEGKEYSFTGDFSVVPEDNDAGM